MSGETNKNLKSVVCAGIVTLVLAGCARANLVDSNTIVEDGIEYYIQTDKALYNLDEDVEMLFRITNLRTEMWQVTAFPPLRDILVAARKGQDFNEIWRLSWFGNYPPGPRVLRLQPGESSEISVIWPQIDAQGTKDPIDDISVAPGIYRIRGILYPTDISVAVDITIVPEPSSALLFMSGLPILNYIRRKRKK